MDRSPTLARLFYLLLPCLCVALLLAGCGSTTSFTVHYPRATWAGCVEGTRSGKSPEGVFRDLRALETYTPLSFQPASQPSGEAPLRASAAQARMVVALGYGASHYYDIRLDGSNPHVLPLPIPCEDLPFNYSGWAVGRLSRRSKGWPPFACRQAHPATKPLEEHLIFPIDPQYAYSSLSWDPTGRYLAIGRISRSGAPSASLDILAVSSQHDRAHLAVRFSNVTEMGTLHWSPDARWIAVTIGGAGRPCLVPLWKLISPLPAFDQAPVYPTLACVPLPDKLDQSIWRSGYPESLTDFAPSGLVSEYDVATGTTQVIGKLVFPPETFESADTCGATWTANGQYLIFALCVPEGGDYLGLPPKLFVYDTLSA